MVWTRTMLMMPSRCVLTEETFFLLVGRLPSLRYLGILSEWGLDR